ncbi:33742_t:CDS:1, partial [Racocetra persica]
STLNVEKLWAPPMSNVKANEATSNAKANGRYKANVHKEYSNQMPRKRRQK